MGSVIVYDNKVLILKRNEDEEVLPGLWELPSGKQEEGENREESLIREVKEETGLDIEIIAFLSSFTYKVKKGKTTKNIIQFNFLVKPGDASPVVKLSSEHSEYKWIGAKDLEKAELSKQIKKVINKYFQTYL
ncbi:MAG TPA: NUDIX domain-containing protein [Patescibacteria group bacterium]|nr:NUDIX domain-containing protein [Patescibacteria group bacterium]